MQQIHIAKLMPDSPAQPAAERMKNVDFFREILIIGVVALHAAGLMLLDAPHVTARLHFPHPPAISSRRIRFFSFCPAMQIKTAKILYHCRQFLSFPFLHKLDWKEFLYYFPVARGGVARVISLHALVAIITGQHICFRKHGYNGLNGAGPRRRAMEGAEKKGEIYGNSKG
jgi:hypothetical protein